MFDFGKSRLGPGALLPAQMPWGKVRRPARDRDMALTGTTRQWLRQLPARRRPLRLCESFPWVANRLAWCWRDPEVSAAVLRDLLQDRRGGRKGFPASVVRELQRLSEFHEHHRTEDSAEPLWDRLVRITGLS
jgi:hypothetical protein